MRPSTYASHRSSMFAEQGTPVSSLTLRDRQGRPVRALRRGAGPSPVIFVHGGMGEAGSWAPLLPHLPADLDVVLVDRPGCGESFAIDYRGLDYRAEAAAFVEDVVAGLGLERPTLVGSSMGGFFVLAYALSNPDNVGAIGLIGAPAGLVSAVPPFIRLLATPVVGSLLQRLTADPTIEQLRKRVFHGQLVVDGARVPDAVLESARLAAQQPGADLAARTMLQNVAGLWSGWRRVIRNEVAALDLPVHFVWGTRDAFESASSGRQLAERMSQAQFVEIEDAGHLPWLDHPADVAAALAPLWQGALTPSTARAQFEGRGDDPFAGAP
jgi:pimeloyl-ACP methyl ester carboxylesterase